MKSLSLKVISISFLLLLISCVSSQEVVVEEETAKLSSSYTAVMDDSTEIHYLYFSEDGTFTEEIFNSSVMGETLYGTYFYEEDTNQIQLYYEGEKMCAGNFREDMNYLILVDCETDIELRYIKE